MFNRTTSEAALVLLVLLEGLLTLLLKVGIVLDTVLSLGLVGVEVLLVHHVATEVPSAPFPCDSFALEFFSTLRWPMTSSTENSRL